MTTSTAGMSLNSPPATERAYEMGELDDADSQGVQFFNAENKNFTQKQNKANNDQIVKANTQHLNLAI